MNEFKKRIQTAIDNFSKKSLKKSRSKKNSKPEKEFVKKLLQHLRNRGFSVNVVESKAVYNPKIGRYLSSQAIPGHSDISGCDPDGIAVFIECKAKGRRSTLKLNQYQFLMDKIEKNAFAVCVDSIEFFDEVYEEFKTLPKNLKKDLLKMNLTKPRQKQRIKSFTV